MSVLRASGKTYVVDDESKATLVFVRAERRNPDAPRYQIAFDVGVGMHIYCCEGFDSVSDVLNFAASLVEDDELAVYHCQHSIEVCSTLEEGLG